MMQLRSTTTTTQLCIGIFSFLLFHVLVIHAQEVTFRPTVNSLSSDLGEYCETSMEPSLAPPLYRGLSCNFGSAGMGWSFQSSNGQEIPGIRGCLSSSEASPSSNVNLPANTMWCPVGLGSGNVFTQDEQVAWGICTCNDCRVMPNAEPSGLVSSGICALNSNNWSYKFDNGTVARGLTSCVDMDMYPPQGYPYLFEGDMPPSSLWCPTQLSFGYYNQTSICDEYDCPPMAWGVCECAPEIAPTASPHINIQPTRSPIAPTTAGENAAGQYCQIQSSNLEGVLQSGNCNFGPLDEWNYQDESGIRYSGLDTCVPVGDLPPMVLDGPDPLPDDLWCPGRFGLDSTQTYVTLDPNLFSEWGLCKCAACRIIPSDLANTPVSEGLCDFGTEARVWRYRFSNGTVHQFDSVTHAVRVRDFPPSTTLPALLNPNALWCPASGALNPETNEYDPTTAASRQNWGLAQCLAEPGTLAPTEFETLPPTRPPGTQFPTFKPTTMQPTKLPTTLKPTTLQPTSLKPTIRATPSPTLVPQPFCRIIGSPPGTTATEGSLCGFNWNTQAWKYVDGNGPVPLNSCVRTMYYMPFGAEATDKFFWCPSVDALLNGDTYVTNQVEGVDRLAWGQCDCEVCEIINLQRDDVFALKSGPCHFGTTGVWYFVNENGARSPPLVGSVYVGDYAPFGSMNLGAETLWCPGQGGLDATNTFYYSGSLTSDMMGWGVCDCESTLNQEYETLTPTSRAPTLKPTTSAPTFKPTTLTPTKLPTKMPTGTASPTFLPTGTASPTPITKTPTRDPTFAPTKEPTLLPTLKPTTSAPIPFGPPGIEPTSNPAITASPTRPTTNYPTIRPTSLKPTKEPTFPRPTTSPTLKPTLKPSTLPPTRAPVPTQTPTLFPTAVAVPTRSPTCCHIVPSGAACNFGTTGEWSYKSPGISEAGLTGCVSVDNYPPNGVDAALLGTGTKWCPNSKGLDTLNVYQYTQQWGVCDCPCMPTETPTTPRPTPSGGIPRLALFIQADHSGSIKNANPLCKEQTRDSITGKAFNCWQLQSHFISNLVNNFTASYGADNFRLYLSTYSCMANDNPIYNVLSWNGNNNEGLTDQGSLAQVNAALDRMANMPQTRMQGTCPSKGANKIYDEMEKVKQDWPVSYFVVTDGRVQYGDRQKYTAAVKRIKRQLKPSGLRVCAATVGFVNADMIYKQMETTCVFNAANFIEIAQKKFAMEFRGMLLSSSDEDRGVISYIPDEQVDDDDDDDDDGLVTRAPAKRTNGGGEEEEHRSKEEEDVTIVLSILATSLVIIGLVAMVAIRQRRQTKRHNTKPIDKSRSEAVVNWMDNPMRPYEAQAGGTSRRRSRASLDKIDVFDLPTAVGLPPNKPRVVNTQLASFMGTVVAEEDTVTWNKSADTAQNRKRRYEGDVDV